MIDSVRVVAMTPAHIDALMPYEHLLPPPYRGGNERIDEPLPAEVGAA